MRTWSSSRRDSGHHSTSLRNLGTRSRNSHMHLLRHSWTWLTLTRIMWYCHPGMALAHRMLLHSTRMRWVGLSHTRHHGVGSRRSTTWRSKYPGTVQDMRLEMLSPPPPASRPTMPPTLSRLVSRSHSTTTVSIAAFRSAVKSWEVGKLTNFVLSRRVPAKSRR